MKKEAKNADFIRKNGFFIRVGTKALNRTAKLSIKHSEKNDFELVFHCSFLQHK
jgi:hypothetical protein